MILGVQELVLLGLAGAAIVFGPRAIPGLIRILGRFPLFQAPLRKVGTLLTLYHAVTGAQSGQTSGYNGPVRDTQCRTRNVRPKE